jgi:hypothetical protein
METKTADIIKALGGATAVAKMCDGADGKQITRQAVHIWVKKNEIPPARLQYLQAVRADVFDSTAKES